MLNNRDELLRRARSILLMRHLDRYGFEEIDEGWLNAQSDAVLQFIVDSSDPSSGFIY
jgi:hypothetical protein